MPQPLREYGFHKLEKIGTQIKGIDTLHNKFFRFRFYKFINISSSLIEMSNDSHELLKCFVVNNREDLKFFCFVFPP